MNHNNTELAVRKTQLLQGKGITYDTGFFNPEVSSREPLAPSVVKREMRVIHDDLHCKTPRRMMLDVKSFTPSSNEMIVSWVSEAPGRGCYN